VLAHGEIVSMEEFLKDNSYLIQFLALSCFLLSACAPLPQPVSSNIPQSCEHLLDATVKSADGKTLMQERDIYASLAEKCNHNPNVLYKLAVSELKLSKFDEGVQLLLAVIDLADDYDKAFYNLGVIYSSDTSSRDLIKAKIAFLKYLELNRKSVKEDKIKKWLEENSAISTFGVFLDEKRFALPGLNKGIMAYEAEDFLTAETEFENYLETHREDLAIRLKLGRSYFKLGKLIESRQEFLKILEMNLSYDKAYYNLGVIYSHKSEFQNYEKALFFFEKYLQYQPRSPKAEKVRNWVSLYK
jgi:tetratricopeptide (TPR) repeat protein